MRIVGVFVGWLLVAVSALFLSSAIGHLVRGPGQTKIPMEVNVGMGLFFVIVGYLGFRLATSKGPGPPPLSPEQQMLSFAQQVGGRVTLAEAVLHCRMSVPEARAVLKDLVRQGLAELHLTESGEEVYAFAGLIPGDKDSAKDPFAS